MRLFIAAPMPDELSIELHEVQRAFAIPGVKPTRDFHMTYQFFGEVDEAWTQELQATIARVPVPVSTVTVSGVDSFGSTPRVIWVGVQVTKTLTDYVHALRTATRVLGFVPDAPFKPHITLARVGPRADMGAVKAALSQVQLSPHMVTIRQAVLYRSFLRPQGPVYEPLAVFESK